jgi:Tfp pilus assembly protein PilO
MNTALGPRIFDEHRGAILTLIVALAANIVVYAAFVYPLSQRVANVEQRNLTAAASLASARRDYAVASGTVNGKSRASRELNTFYTQVLPTDLAGARRLTHLRLAQLAHESGLQLQDATYAPEERRRESSLDRLQIRMELTGSYPAFRSFIHQLEASPEFVVIDNLQLSEEQQGQSPLTVRLDLSTYYRRATS